MGDDRRRLEPGGRDVGSVVAAVLREAIIESSSA
jgi:hypothetical protein